MSPQAACLLTINTGSSSLKAAVYRMSPRPQRLFTIDARNIGQGGKLTVLGPSGDVQEQSDDPLGDHAAALEAMFRRLRAHPPQGPLQAIGHRIVHGGAHHQCPQWVDDRLLADLRSLIPFAPEHLPQSIRAIEVAATALPGVPQVACFDTSFHRSLPNRARHFPLPRTLAEQGLIRYGFHGLSYEFLVEQLRAIDPQRCGGRAVLAHLGNGASMAAVRQGVSIDTSMGFTPAGGLMMGTRCGDLDPGLLVYLMENQNLTTGQLNTLLNRRSGLLGVSGVSSDMHTLLEQRQDRAEAAEAIDMFCYHARKFLGGYAAALGGLDTIVFTGGIGENASPVRSQICAGLDDFGIRLDEAGNTAHADVISGRDSRVVVRVIKTDEDWMIARHTARLWEERN